MSTIEAKIRARRSLPPPALRRAIREAAGASQNDVAQELSVTRPTVCRWESGERSPSPAHLVPYAALLRRLQELAS